MIRRPGPALASALALAFLLAGLGAQFAARPDTARLVWLLGLYLVGSPLVLRTVRGAIRGAWAADLVASLAILGAMILVQPFAGLVVVLMQTGGEALERSAARRASRAVQELEAQAPRMAHRREGRALVDLPAAAVQAGDLVLVRPGEMVPCDGEVEEGEAQVDIARITGEPVPLAGRPGVRLRSGSLVLDGPLELRVHRVAADSLYERVVELVRTAQASKAPLQRLADRVALWFTPMTLATCALAWGVSGNPTTVLAVLVVATPCPLLLATPVAIIGGINRAARRRIIVRHGGALEALAAVDTAVFDKTGTVTLGQPEVARVQPMPPFDERTVLALAAAVEHGAGHQLARSLIRHAAREGVALLPARGVTEAPGRGVSGTVEGRRVLLGALSLIRDREPHAAADLEWARAGGGGREGKGGGGMVAYLAVDGRAGGVISFSDRPRPEAREALSRLRELGLGRQMLVSGDHPQAVARVAEALGLSEGAGDLLPADKVAYVDRLRQAGHQVLMVGDGINDAPALSAATVGLALAQHGGGIAAESADVVLLENDLGRVPEAVHIGRETMRVARQSLGVGLGLSFAAMVAAALGHIPPAIGAVVQEAIDLAVILNALRAARGM